MDVSNVRVGLLDQLAQMEVQVYQDPMECRVLAYQHRESECQVLQVHLVMLACREHLDSPEDQDHPGRLEHEELDNRDNQGHLDQLVCLERPDSQEMLEASRDRDHLDCPEDPVYLVHLVWTDYLERLASLVHLEATPLIVLALDELVVSSVRRNSLSEIPSNVQ